MIKNVILFLFIVFSGQLIGQELNKIIVDPKLDKEILIGKCDRQGLNSDVFKTYFSEGYNTYKPDENTIKQLKKKIRDVDIVIVMGTWCGDSREQVPAFYKILDDLGVKKSNITLICVDRSLTAGDVDISKYSIQRVPTFIFYKKGREQGRIVESPTSTLEKDMLLILSLN